MLDPSSPAMNDQLAKQTSIFGLRLWVVVGVCVGAAIVLLLFLISIWLVSKRSKTNLSSQRPSIPPVSKEIHEIRIDQQSDPKQKGARVISDPVAEPDPVPGIERQALLTTSEEENPSGINRIQFEIGKNHRICFPERALARSSSHGSGEVRNVEQVPTVIPEVSHLGWGHWYTLRELEDATNGFADENVIGEGGYGIVYHGVLKDNTNVAVKNLLNNRY